ncbi:hypothetical protein APHAL10511_003361 [Amanita phalloides]|nr:hypothetical protein APHAL10511_003361 [Amanita phalloides]
MASLQPIAPVIGSPEGAELGHVQEPAELVWDVPKDPASPAAGGQIGIGGASDPVAAACKHSLFYAKQCALFICSISRKLSGPFNFKLAVSPEL